MKKLLTFLTLLTLSIGVSWAATNVWSEDWSGAEANQTPSQVSNPNATYTSTGTGTKIYNESLAGGTAPELLVAKSGGTFTATINLNGVSGELTLEYYCNQNNIGVSSSTTGVTVGNATASGNHYTRTITVPSYLNASTLVITFTQSGSKNARLDNIVLSYEGGTSYTISYGTPTNGSFASGNPTSAAAGSNVTIATTPDEGFALSAVTVTPSATVTLNGNNASFEMPASNVTVNATFAAKPTYSITVNGGGSASPNPAYEGQTVTVTVTEGKMIDTYTSIPAITLTPSGNAYTFVMPNEAVTITLTLKDKPVQSGKFERIISTTQLEKDVRYLLVYETAPAVMGVISTTNTKYGTSVPESGNFSYSSGVITLSSTTDAKPVTLGGNADDGWTFDLDGNTLCWTGGNSLNVGNSGNTWNIDFSGNNVIISNKNDEDRQIGYNTQSGSLRFATYDWPDLAANTTVRNIQLYKEVGNTVTVSDLYLIGKYMNSQEGDVGCNDWKITDGPQFTYSNTAGTYAVDAYFDLDERGYFQFVEGLSTDGTWGTLTGRYYASSNDGDVPVDSYNGNPLPMDGEHALYFTNSTQYSPGEYAFTIPAGLYTIVVDKPNWKIYVTQHPVTMTINNNTSGTTYFVEGSTRTATLVSNLTEYDGAKIYYTTDGSDPTNSNTRQVYSGPIQISATTTVKAIAELNHIKSTLAQRDFVMTPQAPTFEPEGGYIHEETPVTISCATQGATIYYTTGEGDPTNESTLYEGPITVNATTTIKAIAYLNGVYSQVSTATYTFSGGIEPGENDFILVTNENQLKAGVEYIIVNQVNKMALGTYQKPANREAVSVTLSDDDLLATLNDNIQVVTLQGDASGWYLKITATDQYPNGGYLYATGSSSRNELKTTEEIVDGAKALITIASNAKATVAFQVPKENYDNEIEIKPYYLRYNTASDGLFTCYTGANDQLDVYLYYRGDVTPPVPTEATLAEIIALGENADGKLYKISNENGLLGVYSQGQSVWFKDEYPEQAVDYQNPIPTTGTYEYYTVVEDALEINKSEKDFDQSNWIEVVFQDNASYNNKYVKNLTGTYSWNNGNPKLTLTVDVDETNDVSDVPVGALAYDLNPYMAANFVGNQEYTNSQGVTSTYFFSKPKAQEYAQILWAVWDGSKFNMPTTNNAYGFTGSFTVSDELNGGVSLDGLQQGKTYNFKAVIRKTASKAGSYEVYPTDLNPGVVTGVGMINVNGNVKSVKYVNVAGIVSDVPFQGVNIVVTEYTDGSRTTTKMLKK